MIWKPTKQYGHMHTHDTKKETYAIEEIIINNNFHAVLTYYFKKKTPQNSRNIYLVKLESDQNTLLCS